MKCSTSSWREAAHRASECSGPPRMWAMAVFGGLLAVLALPAWLWASQSVDDTAWAATVARSEEAGEWVTVVHPADGLVLVVEEDAVQIPLGFAVEGNESQAPQGVTYFLDGYAMGTADAPPYVVATGDLTALEPGEHVVATGTQEPASDLAPAFFTLDHAEPDADSDQNGLPDNPFVTLPGDNYTWYSTVVSPETGYPRAVGVARWEGSEDHDGSLYLVLQDPSNPRGKVVVSAPRALAQPGETGLLLVALASDPLTLLGAEEARLLAPQPNGDLVPGGQYVEISVLISVDGGQTLYELDNSRLAENPIHVRMEGLDLDMDLDPGFHAYPTLIDSDPETGLFILAGTGQWATEHTAHETAGAESMEADLTAPSVIAPYESVLTEDDDDSDEGTGDDESAGSRPVRDAFMSWLSSIGDGGTTAAGSSGRAAKASADTVWVDFDYTGVEHGTEAEPFNTAQEGTDFVGTGGTVKFKGRVPIPMSAESYTISKAMTLEAVGGAVRIGAPATAPSAAFSAAPLSGASSPSGLAVQFTNESGSGGSPVTAWHWDFGDGTTSPAVHPAHTYAEVGTYTVSLKATNATDEDTEEKVDYIMAKATLTTAVTGSGSIALSPTGGVYNADTGVLMTATPDTTDWEFSEWTGDFSSSEYEDTITMDDDKSVTAVFIEKPSDLEVTSIDTPPPSTVQSGDSVTIAWTVTNNHWTTELSWDDAVYLSRNSQWDAEDMELNSVEITGGLDEDESYGESASVQITIPDVSPGGYYLIVKTDINDVIGETLEDKGNNAASSPVTIVDKDMNNV